MHTTFNLAKNSCQKLLRTKITLTHTHTRTPTKVDLAENSIFPKITKD